MIFNVFACSFFFLTIPLLSFFQHRLNLRIRLQSVGIALKFTTGSDTGNMRHKSQGLLFVTCDQLSHCNHIETNLEWRTKNVSVVMWTWTSVGASLDQVATQASQKNLLPTTVLSSWPRQSSKSGGTRGVFWTWRLQCFSVKLKFLQMCFVRC